MGMYTEFHYNVKLIKQIPPDLFKILQYMVGDIEERPSVIPNHELFSCARWEYMLQCDSFYFVAQTNSEISWDEFGNAYLGIRCNLKNYGGEIEKFCNWIRPYIKAFDGDFLGFSRYEESETPKLIYA